jgi:dTDP-4-dehydrorhamnose reductase
MNKKVLITGALGQLGNTLYSVLRHKYDIILTDAIKTSNKNYIELDITNSYEVDQIFSKYEPDIVINLAATTDVDQCEKQPKMTKNVNTDSVKTLLKHHDGKFVQISTDYVFDGKNGPYVESDKTNPINVYGKTKLEAEQYISNNYNDWCIIRTNVLFDYQQRTKASFIKWVVDSLQNGQEIYAVNDQWNNPTWTFDLAKIIELILLFDKRDLYHYGGADYLNRYDFALMIAEVFNLDQRLILPIKTAELNQLARRPLKGGLITNKIEQTLNINCNKLYDSLLEIKSRMN